MLYMLLLLQILPISARLCTPLQQIQRIAYKLTGHVIKTYSFIEKSEVCIEACSMNKECSSINLYRVNKTCELNKANHVSNPGNMTAAMNSEYIDYPQHPPTKCVNGALGMEDGRIADNQVTASSMYVNMYPYNGRLNLASMDQRSGWAVKTANVNQWLQMDLLRKVHVHAIAIQGLDNIDQWVTTYCLQYSNDGVSFADYKRGHVWTGNNDRNTVVKNVLIPAISARYIRVIPKSWNYWIAMRIELYGCDF